MSYNVGDWVWANQANQTINTYSYSLTISTFSNGESIIGGIFFDTSNFDNITLSSTNVRNGFIAKIDNSGNWIWAKQISNTNSSSILFIKTKDDYAIVTGSYQGDIDFDEITLTGNSETSNTFVAKIDSSGNWIWVTSSTSTTDNFSAALEITNDESIIVVGNFYTEITFGDITLDESVSNNILNGYIAKLDSSGNNWIWAQKIISSDYVGIYAIKLLSNENIVICGEFVEETTFGDITLTSSQYNTYIAKLDSSGNWISVITFDDNHSSYNSCSSLTVLSDDSIIITGAYTDTITIGNTTLINNGNLNIYVIKLDVSNNWLWGISANSEDHCYPNIIKSLPSGATIIGGTFSSTLTCANTTLTTDTTNLFIAKIDTYGQWVWAFSPEVIIENNYDDIQLNRVYDLYIYDQTIIITGPIRDTISFGEIVLTSDYDCSAYVAKMYIGEDTDINTNIPNELASSSITTTNSILENKNNVIKELYNIHNLKKYKLNYMLKNIINKEPNNNNIDPTANLINLYYK